MMSPSSIVVPLQIRASLRRCPARGMIALRMVFSRLAMSAGESAARSVSGSSIIPKSGRCCVPSGLLCFMPREADSSPRASMIPPDDRVQPSALIGMPSSFDCSFESRIDGNTIRAPTQ